MYIDKKLIFWRLILISFYKCNKSVKISVKTIFPCILILIHKLHTTFTVYIERIPFGYISSKIIIEQSMINDHIGNTHVGLLDGSEQINIDFLLLFIDYTLSVCVFKLKKKHQQARLSFKMIKSFFFKFTL